MEITEIRKKVGSKDLYEVYIDGVLAFEVRAIDLYKFGIRKKKKYQKKELELLKLKIQISFAKEIAIKYLLFKKRTAMEVRNKLSNFDAKIIDVVVDELKESGYINDKQYIAKYIVENQKINNWSINKIKNNLLQKGLNINDIDRTMSELRYDEIEKAEFMLKKVLKSDILPKDFKEISKVKRYLYNKGFSIETINKVVNDYNFIDR